MLECEPHVELAPLSLTEGGQEARTLAFCISSLRSGARRRALREVVPAWQQAFLELDVPFQVRNGRC